MITIVLDLEFCKIGRKNKPIRTISHQEIIQIGAVKLDENDEIIDKYERIVKPIYGHIDHTVQSLTHLTDEIVGRGMLYPDAMKEFLDWIGDEEALMCSWSMEDRGQIIRENRLKEYEEPRLTKLLGNWVDIQKLFDDKLCVSQQISLHAALNGAGITFVGQEHSAADDAENTAYLYQMMKDEERFKKKMAPLIEALQPSEELSYSLESLIKKAMKDA